MRKIFLLLGLLICFSGLSQNPDYHRFGARTKFMQLDTLTTSQRNAITPKLSMIIYHKDTGISQTEQWDGTNWAPFGSDIGYSDIDVSNFNYDQYISQNEVKKYIDSNALGVGHYRVKHPSELSAFDNINVVYDNGEHNAFPSLMKTKEGRVIVGYRASPVDHNSPIARAEIMISYDNGNTFDDPIVVDDGTDFSGTEYGIRNCYITQLSDGSLIATYGVNDDANGSVYYKFSSDGGETWGSRTTLAVSGYTPDKIAMESKWLEIDGDYILPIVSGINTELDAGFIRTSDFSTFTHTFLTSDTTRYQETRGYIDNSNNTIIFFYQYPVNPDAVLYRQIYDPINNTVISGQTSVTIPSYRACRTDLLFDENRGEMYLFARSTFGGPPRLLVSTDKGLSFNELFVLDEVTGRLVYGEFLQVSQNEALFVFATENEPNGTETKLRMSTFNISPTQLFSYDGTNVTEISSSYLPKNQNLSHIQSQIDSKLDTLDYTAADVLSKLLTVDGSGSGLDADLLDGINSEGFLRSDAADSKTSGNLTFENQTRIVFGSPSAAQMYENGSGSLYLILNSANFNIYDGFSTPRFTFGRTTGNLTATGTVTANAAEFTGTASGADPVNSDDFVTKGYGDANYAITTSGTFTPTLIDLGGGGTYTIGTLSNNNYYKIGNLVYFSFQATSISTSGAPSSTFEIRGLPYAILGQSTSSVYVTGSSVSFYSISAQMSTISANNVIRLQVQTALDGSMAALNAVTFTAGVIQISGTYITP